ncbi:MAG: DUF2357 domain-containing protein [Planctomycetes bacterium]|nr:DUF2357 domain-containing protein [Planctomycetota bacterium]
MQDWCVLASPWASNPTQSKDLLVGGRPLLLVDSAVGKVLAPDLNLSLPQLGTRLIGSKLWRVFDMLAPGRQAGSAEELVLQIGHDRQRFSLYGGASYPLYGEKELDEAALGSRVKTFLGSHVDLVYSPVEKQKRLVDGCASIDLREFLSDWTEREYDGEAHLALIVKIAQAVGRVTKDIGDNPRRVLRRERKMERVGAVRQIDPAGLRWLVRQQGNTLAERAGPRQRILAVTREQSFDTLENRVMRDFLSRTKTEGRSWLRDQISPCLLKSSRYMDVQRFASLVSRLGHDSPIAGLRRSSNTTAPNYVLQHDERYSRIWPWYVKLRRKQQEEDRMWRWSHRTFSEAIHLAFSNALDLLEPTNLPPGVGFKRTLLVREEQSYGQFVDSRSEFFGWLYGGDHELFTVSLLSGDQILDFERNRGGVSRFSDLVPDSLMAAHDPFSLQPAGRVLLVWTRMHMGGGDDVATRVEELAESVAQVSGETTAHVLLVEPCPFGEDARIVEDVLVRTTVGKAIRVWILQTPFHVTRGQKEFRSVVEQALLGGGRN